MSDLGISIPEDQDDITILHDLQLHDEDGNPYVGSPPQFQFFSEREASASAPPDTAGSIAALKTAYDHVRGQNEQYRRQNEHIKKLYKVSNDKLKQKQMLAQVTPTLTLHSAAASGNVDQIHELLESKIDVNACNSEGRTALHTAATSSTSNVCSLLLHAKADPNSADNDGRCPIHMACRNGDVDSSSLLIEFGADVNAMDRDGRTPLHIAATNGHPELCKLLLDTGKEAGLEINQTDLYGQTPLSMAKLNDHQDVFKLLEDAGASLPTESNEIRVIDRSDDSSHGNSDMPAIQQVPKLLNIIQSLYRILGILINKVDVLAAEFPDIRERIEKLLASSQSVTENSDVNDLKSIEQTVVGVIDLEDWLNHRPQSEHQESVTSGQEDVRLGLERQLADVKRELSVVRKQLEEECRKTKSLNEKASEQEFKIERLMADADNLDLYSATNLGEEEGEPYDIGQLFSKVGALETSSKEMKELIQQHFRQIRGPQPQQVLKMRQASSLPTPQRNQTAGTRRASSLQGENGQSRNIHQIHDIRLPPSDLHQQTSATNRPHQVVTTNPQRQEAVSHRHGSTGHMPMSQRQQELVKPPGPDSWPREQRNNSPDLRRLSQSDPTRIQDSGTSRQTPNRSSGFVPRSPSREPNQPFESVRGPPASEYASQSQSQTRYVEGASQIHLYEDGLPPSPRHVEGQANQRYLPIPTAGTAHVQRHNIFPISCSDERQRIGAADQIVIPGGKVPEEGVWNDQVFVQQRDELATGHEPIQQPRHNQQQAGFNASRLPQKQPQCPVCNREFALGTPEENMTAHVNRHFDNTAGVGDDFEVLPSQ